MRTRCVWKGLELDLYPEVEGEGCHGSDKGVITLPFYRGFGNANCPSLISHLFPLPFLILMKLLQVFIWVSGVRSNGRKRYFVSMFLGKAQAGVEF